MAAKSVLLLYSKVLISFTVPPKLYTSVPFFLSVLVMLLSTNVQFTMSAEAALAVASLEARFPNAPAR